MLGVFSKYDYLYNYAKAYSENRYEEEVYEEDAYEGELSFIGKETDTITLFTVEETSLNPTIEKG